MRVPQLFPYLGPSMQDNSRSGRDYVPTCLRAGMRDSTDPTRSSEADLQLAPGRHLFLFFAGIGSSNCGLGALIDVEPKRQYEIEFRFDANHRARDTRQHSRLSSPTPHPSPTALRVSAACVSTHSQNRSTSGRVRLPGAVTSQ